MHCNEVLKFFKFDRLTLSVWCCFLRTVGELGFHLRQ